MSPLRFGILPLHIETGRFVNTNLNERKWNCFIFDCRVFIQEREMLFNYIINEEVGLLTLSRTIQLKIMCEK